MSNPARLTEVLRRYTSDRSGAPSYLFRTANDRGVTARINSGPRDRRKRQHGSDGIIPPLSNADPNRSEAIANLLVPFNLAQFTVNEHHRIVKAKPLIAL